MELRTTTRRSRNLAVLEEARSLLARPAPGEVMRVLEVGPGLAVKYLGRAPARIRPVVQPLETVLRRLPMPDACFENYETGEILSIFAGWPIALTLIDINPRVLRIVQGNHGAAALDAKTVDLGETGNPTIESLSRRFEVIVALSTLSRVPRAVRQIAVLNLRRMAKPGALIVVNDIDISGPGCRLVPSSSVIYRET